jgi:glycosyltransferase involved in cell wall biosynthesis
MDNLEGLAKISLVVITYNEEDNIGRCLESASGVGEIIVVDSFSGDDTVRIAERYGASVFQREFMSNADQKNWAISKAVHDWILILDADESLTAGLREEIAAKVMDDDHDGYWLYRSSEFLGHRIRFCGWRRDKVLRLFRRGTGRYRERTVHEKLKLEGRAGRLMEKLRHRPYRDLDDYLDRMRRYSRRGAEELHRKGRRWMPGLLLRPPARFLRMYLLQLGFLDGLHGFMLCVLASVGVFVKYAWLRELRRGGGEGNG